MYRTWKLYQSSTKCKQLGNFFLKKKKDESCGYYGESPLMLVVCSFGIYYENISNLSG